MATVGVKGLKDILNCISDILCTRWDFNHTSCYLSYTALTTVSRSHY